MPEKLKLMLCINYQKEAKEIFQLHQWNDVELHLFPEVCHQPELRLRVAAKIKNDPSRAAGDFLLLGGCFPELEPPAAANPQKCACCLDQCFYMVAGRTLVDQMISQGHYMITPGWLDEWSDHLAQWGFDQPTAREFFHEGAQKIALLDTGLNPSSPAKLQDFGDYLQLPVTVLPVGLDYFDLYLSQKVAQWQLKTAQDQAKAAWAELHRNTADNAMAFDLMTRLTRSMSENEAIEELISLFTMLFSPDLLVYSRMVDGE